MYARISYLILVFLTLATNLAKCEHESNTIEKLLFKLFQDYNLMVRPQNNVSKITEINTELKLLQVDLDEKFQELVSIVWLEMSWTDDRFIWNASKFDDIKDIILPANKIWLPDIVLQNGVGKNEYLYDMKHFNPWISHTGLVTWVPEIRINTKCTINVANFPFDTQKCEISFYSWAHTIKQMKIQQYENKNVTNITHLNLNTEWLVFHTCALNKTITTSAGLEWWTTTYVIFIKRRNYYHIFNLIVPYMILTLCSVNLFLLPPETGEKISLAVSLLLTFFLNLAILNSYIPESSNELPIIALYYLFNICLISTSLAASVCVLNIYFRTEQDSKVPKWLKRALFINSNNNEHISNDKDFNDESSTYYYEQMKFRSFKCKNSAAESFKAPKISNDRKTSSNYVLSTFLMANNQSKIRKDDTKSKPKHTIYFNRAVSNNASPSAKLSISQNSNLPKKSKQGSNKRSSHFNKTKSYKKTKNYQLDNNIADIEKCSKYLSSKILKLFDNLVQNVEKQHERLVYDKLVNTSATLSISSRRSEWRAVGLRVDQILFVISICTVCLSQGIFFWKFYQKNLIPECNGCECENII